MLKVTKLANALTTLKIYSGENPYIISLKKDYGRQGRNFNLSDFQIEYIEKNKDKEPREINRITKITKWLGESLKEKWNTEFIPEKLKIVSYYGETDTIYHCLVRYRQSVPPVSVFLPKKGIITNFLYEDYNLLDIDFSKYDALSTKLDPNRKIKEHQKDAVKFLISRKRCILADDQGLGKTCALSVASIEGGFDSVLIICPASLKSNWKKELMWYIPEKEISIIESFTNKNKNELEAFLGYSEGASSKTREELLAEAENYGKWQENKFVIVNYDILDDFYTFTRATTEEAKKKILANNPLLSFIYGKKSCIIIDEAHKLSNNTSIRYKVIRDLIKKGNPDSVYLATGTPVTNNPLNLYYLLHLIENDVTGDYEYYVNTYCDAKKIPAKGEKEKWTRYFLNYRHKNNWYDLTWQEKEELKVYIRNHARMITLANGAANLDELKEKISHIYLRRTKEQLNELPQKTIHEMFYSLTEKQKTEYDQLWKEYEEAKKEENPEKILNKELLEGGLYRKYISNAMVPNTIKLCDKIVGNGEKVVIACCYDEELYALQQYYGDKCVIYNGKINSKQKDKAIKEFMTNPKIMVFLGNIVAAGVGLTLTSAHKLVFNNISYVPGDNIQMQDRIHRIGQKNEVDIYYQIFRDTQYEKMWDIVLRKSLIINAIIKREDEK